MRVFRFMGGLLMALCATLTLSICIASPPVAARSITYDLDIPSQGLDQALQQFALASQLKLLYRPELVEGKTSVALKGAYTPEQALQTLLDGTNLDYEITPSAVVLILDKRSKHAPVATGAGSSVPFSRGVMGVSATRVLLAQAEGQQGSGAERKSSSTPAGAEPARTVEHAAADRIEEVLVTARRREENLQVVPIAVTAIDGKTLDAMGVKNAFDIAGRVPNVLTASAGGPDQKAISIGIRGVQAKSQLLLDDPPVGTVYAESVVPHPYGFGDLFDIQSVQVLKGPQGTLFGRNTTGGVMVIEPNRASIDEGFGGTTSVTVGDYNWRQVEAAVNVPLNDVVAFRVAGIHKQRDGFSENILTGKEWDDVDLDAVRASLLLKPTENISSHTTFDYLDDETLPASLRLLEVYPGGGALLGGNAQANVLLQEQRARGFYDFASYSGTNGPLDLMMPSRCQSNPASPFQPFCRDKKQPRAYVRVKGAINNTKIDFDGFSVKNIFSYRDGDRHNDGNSSWSNASLGPVTGYGNVNIQDQEFTTYSDELQVSGQAFDKRLDWVTGLFWMKEDGSDASVSFQGVGTAVPAAQFRSLGELKNEAWGVYAQGTYAITDKLKATAGIRRNEDKREGELTNFNTNVLTGVRTCSIFNGSTNTVLPFANCNLSGDEEWSENTWTLALDYQLTADTLIYGTTRRGYKAGGFFFRAVRANLFDYDPEYVRDYEIGIKSDWSLFDRPIRTNLALFRADYTDQQLPVNDLTQIPITGFVDNVGKSRYQGVELEVTYKPLSQVALSGFVSYIDHEYRSYTQPGTGVDLSWQTTQQPLTHWLGGLSAAYTQPLDGDLGTLDLRADLSARSKVITNNDVQPLIFSEYPQPGYTLINLRAGWRRPMGSPIDVELLVTNLTDREYSTGGSSINGFSTYGVGAPRMFGVEVSYQFGSSAGR